MALLPLLAGGLTVKGINKRNESKKQDKVTGNYQRDFPISNDCSELDESIRLAQFELVKVTNEPANTKGSKRARDRAVGILSKWVDTLKNYRKDLTCGMATKVPLNQQSGNVVAQPMPQLMPQPMPQPMPSTMSAITTNDNTGVNDTNSNSTDLSNNNTDSAAKKPNYLLIGGVGLLGVVVLYFVIKKR